MKFIDSTIPIPRKYTYKDLAVGSLFIFLGVEVNGVYIKTYYPIRAEYGYSSLRSGQHMVITNWEIDVQLVDGTLTYNKV